MNTLMNQHGVIRKEIDYDAFRNVSSESNSDDAAHGYTGAVDQLFKFTGRYTDEDTGLQNNLHRWYDPKIGRWLVGNHRRRPIFYWTQKNVYPLAEQLVEAGWTTIDGAVMRGLELLDTNT